MSILESLEYNIKSLENLQDKVAYLENSAGLLKKEVRDIEGRIELISSSRDYYTKAIDVIYRESLGALKDTLNMAVKYVMYDKNYSVDLVLDDKRGTKTLDIKLTDEDEGFTVGLKHSCGQGVRTIISAVLKVYYLLNQGSKVLLLDEKYSALSSSYVQGFFEFLEKLCKEQGMILVLITHDERFMVYGDKSFLINNGKLVDIPKEEDEDEE